MTAPPRLPDDLAHRVQLCQYHAPPLTTPELAAIADYHRAVPHCLVHTPLESLDDGPADAAQALRRHATFTRWWHDALERLLADPRLANPDRDSPKPYSPAAHVFIDLAVATYHRERRHREHAVTTWVLRHMQAPADYPEDTRGWTPHTRALTFLD
ncbi:hypothetical protein [Streptomyces sp. NPDC049879]|uniref:hypothetical protein n=1 Tax=Streptomyces sp. NPDC049879 TaxID=3365598 RepID=UPI0037996D8F